MLILSFNAGAFTDLLPDPFFFGFVPFLAAVSLAVFLLRQDSTPRHGVILFTAALVCTAVQLWGGSSGPAAFIYPLLFLWMKRDSIGGPLLVTAGLLAAVEFIAPVVSGTGIKTGSFDMTGFLEVLSQSLVAAVIPLVSLFAVDSMTEEKRSESSFLQENSGKEKDSSPGFPDDVARSLIPILKEGTGANGVFLFTKADEEVWTLNEFAADSGGISRRYMTGPDDPVIQVLEESPDTIVRTVSERLSIGGSTGLPWYIQGGRFPWVALARFRRNGILSGFMVLDFETRESRNNSLSILSDSAFLLSASWELVRKSNDTGFTAFCEEMEHTREVRGAVHRLIGRIVSTFKGTTATVAIVSRPDTLTVFECMGSLGDGRGGREFGMSEGFAGLAVSRREPLRRLRMGTGRTFGESEDSARVAGSCCAVPLEDRGAVIGVLTVESAAEQFFSVEDLSLFKAFATVFTLAVSRNQLMEKILKLRESDRLTGLPLLSAFHEELADLVRGVRSRALSVTVLAVDINGFTSINEDYGYTTGDSVLRSTAERLRKALGEKAMLSRYGPDGFLVCLVEVDRVSAEAYAARIHEEFAHGPVNIAGRDITVLVCIGGAVSHVDRMIRKLPAIAVRMAEGIALRPGLSSITEVGQFFETENTQKRK